MAKERPPLEEMTLRQLRKVASEYGISRYSRMRKAQLLASIQEIERTKYKENQARGLEAQEEVEAAKFELGQEDITGGELTSVDEGLAELPGGYGESRIVLMPRDPQWAYAYWDVPNERKEELRRQGGQQLALRIYDVTDINLDRQAPHSIQEYLCDELAREWYIPIPVSDRDYIVDIGYRTFDGRWLILARSAPVHIPPVYPSDWIEDHFLTVNWEEELRGKTFIQLHPPTKRIAVTGIYDQMYQLAQAAEADRVTGSLFGSMQHVPGSVPGSAQMIGASEKYIGASEKYIGASEKYIGASEKYIGASERYIGASEKYIGASERYIGASEQYIGASEQYIGASERYIGASEQYALSSYVFASGVGMWAVPTVSGLTMSGVGFSASLPIARPRKFWLIADAELIVYGATEPDATVTIGGRPIKLNPDGTFRFQMSFQDGLIDYPIMAVAADGEQTRSIHMKFTRETPSRNTNTKEEAVLEWIG
ncbi:MAG: DUF4912 domain-containing protein [Oscillatoriaceae bacterium SKYG93]|nr:DUF4912 domain-containing protein [Oscillatoriaceae bacterium SKYG93]MDW8452680.1 DUF4912 domain-containing protein [Oscillatoriaceae cyanobacterium SKYGB_i_bin93]